MKPKKFREIRDRLGLTQKELAEILGLSSYLSVTHFESGFRTPGSLIRALMHIFDDWPEKKSLELRDALKTHHSNKLKPTRKANDA